MQVVTIVTRDAIACAIIVRTFSAGADIVLVQVIALVAFFAETFEPMLAD